ncbi:MAG: hypothetical protein EYC68_09150 [Chloroflexota bacterium]|nr:MAG: hypothetical protein EYC68_09150 [Chloroflexota bacterium]
MKIWLNAQLSPDLAVWMTKEFGVTTIAIRDLGLRDEIDSKIFDRAKIESAIVMTKDSDLVDLVNARGAPPQIIWLTCGNTSNAKLKEILTKAMPQAIRLLEAGEKVVEIRGK